MNHPSKKAPESSKKRLRAVVVLLGFAAGMTVLLLLVSDTTTGSRDPFFHGKPESEWIKDLKYRDDAQPKKWRSFGNEGVQVLIRGSDRADRSRPAERMYRQLYRRMPQFALRWLPWPKADSTLSTRRAIASLLCGLGMDAKNATPIMLRTLVHDEDAHVRTLAICFFTSSQLENFGNCWLNKLSTVEKLALLPLFIGALQDESSEVRFHAAVALKFYPEQFGTTAPMLARGLNDPATYARLRMADTLNEIAPDAAKKANVVAAVSPLLSDPDWSVALEAAKLLGKCRQDSEAAIAALQGGVSSTNEAIVFESVWSSLQYEAQRASVTSDLEGVAKKNAIVERSLYNSKLRLHLQSRSTADASKQ